MALGPETMEVLQDLRAAYARNGGWPVRVRDLQGKRSSPSTIHTHLRKLERAGLIERGSSKMGWRPL